MQFNGLEKWSMYESSALTLRHSAFCPHSAYTRTVCVSHDTQSKTELSNLTSINRVLFVMETQCIICEVGTKFLNII
jgi:hypothetical protein